MSEREKNPAAVALGRLGGKKGGFARAAKLTPEERSEAARKASEARWESVRKAEANAWQEEGGQPPGTTRAERARAYIEGASRRAAKSNPKP